MSDRPRKPPHRKPPAGPAPTEAPAAGGRLVAVELDPASISRSTADVEHERAVAIYDLLEENLFHPEGHLHPQGDAGAEYRLRLAVVERKLMFVVTTVADEPVTTHFLSLSPLRRLVQDYFLVCDSYYAAIRTAAPSRIEAIDMGRRSLHDEGSRLLMERLKGKIRVDFETARRLFTLICALHWKG